MTELEKPRVDQPDPVVDADLAEDDLVDVEPGDSGSLEDETTSEAGPAVKAERTPPSPEVLALGRQIVDTLVDRQAGDVTLLDISPLASFADYFVIATGTSERHLIALRDALDEALDADGLQPLQIEGEPDSGWVLMDYGDVIVHLFDAKTREYYRLERIWSKAPTIVRVL
jgi:ribosome-associated protein